MNALRKKIEETEDTFNEAMTKAKTATDEALVDIRRSSHEMKLGARYARMWAYKVQKTILELRDLSRVPSLSVSSGGGTTKDEGARPLDLDLFDENDGETEAERRMWAARDAYDMRDGK